MQAVPNLSHWAVTHRQMVLFLLVAILASGVVAFLKLGRLEDPNFRVPTMTAIVVWPGATAREVQDQALNRIEKELRELDGFENVRSFSRQGYGAITLWLDGGTPKHEQEAAWYQARKKIGDLRGQMPPGVIGPAINDEFSDVYSLIWSVRGDGFSLAELNREAERIKLALVAVPMVSKVDVLGKQPEKVFVEISHRKLANLGIPLSAVFDALGRQNGLARSTRAATACCCGSTGRCATSTTCAGCRCRPTAACCAWATSRRCGAAMKTRRSTPSATTARRRWRSA
jgi:multidrug efflux pump subunit AcrB